MKKSLRGYDLLVIAVAALFIFTGCTVRTYTVQTKRQDRVVEGNRGYLTGKAKEEGEVKETRKTYVFELEFGKGSSAAPQQIITDDAVEVETGPVADEFEAEIIEEPVVYKVQNLK